MPEQREHEGSALTLGTAFRYLAVLLGGGLTFGGAIVSIVLYLGGMQTSFNAALAAQKAEADGKNAIVTQQLSNQQVTTAAFKDATAAQFAQWDKEKTEIRARRDNQVQGLDVRVTNLEKVVSDVNLTLAKMNARGEESNKMLHDVLDRMPADHATADKR